MGTTSTFLKSRVSKPTVGKWSSGFSEVKKYADEHGIPLVGVWSNGDACGYCTNLEKTFMDDVFVKWMADSGCVFWFGCSSDKTTDDKKQGNGYIWAGNSGLLRTFPFVRVWWKKGGVDVAKSGNDWTGGGAKNAQILVKRLSDVLSKFKPGCEGDCCNESDCGGCCDCEDAKVEIGELRLALRNFTADMEAKFDALEDKLCK